MQVQVAAGQMSSQDDIWANLAIIKHLAEQAAQSGVQLLVLPENFACFAAGQQYQTALQFNQICDFIGELAARFNLWIVAGSIPCLTRPDGQHVSEPRVRSACIVFNAAGQIIARYDKIHLFDVIVSDTTGHYLESATFEGGTEAVIVPTPFGSLGLMICYDVRFPLLALRLRQLGADFLVVPAAFTFTTGQMHWLLLLQARAIDTQCAVIGAAQTGQHGTRHTWGHSAIVAADGHIVAQCEHEQPYLVSAIIDLTKQHTLRQQMPLMTHQRFI